jgi:hypothetical protein
VRDIKERRGRKIINGASLSLISDLRFQIYVYIHMRRHVNEI